MPLELGRRVKECTSLLFGRNKKEEQPGVPVTIGEHKNFLHKSAALYTLMGVDGEITAATCRKKIDKFYTADSIRNPSTKFF